MSAPALTCCICKNTFSSPHDLNGHQEHCIITTPYEKIAARLHKHKHAQVPFKIPRNAAGAPIPPRRIPAPLRYKQPTTTATVTAPPPLTPPQPLPVKASSPQSQAAAPVPAEQSIDESPLLTSSLTPWPSCDPCRRVFQDREGLAWHIYRSNAHEADRTQMAEEKRMRKEQRASGMREIEGQGKEKQKEITKAVAPAPRADILKRPALVEAVAPPPKKEVVHNPTPKLDAKMITPSPKKDIAHNPALRLEIKMVTPLPKGGIAHHPRPGLEIKAPAPSVGAGSPKKPRIDTTINASGEVKLWVSTAFEQHTAAAEARPTPRDESVALQAIQPRPNVPGQNGEADKKPVVPTNEDLMVETSKSNTAPQASQSVAAKQTIDLPVQNGVRPQPGKGKGKELEGIKFQCSRCENRETFATALMLAIHTRDVHQDFAHAPRALGIAQHAIAAKLIINPTQQNGVIGKEPVVTTNRGTIAETPKSDAAPQASQLVIANPKIDRPVQNGVGLKPKFKRKEPEGIRFQCSRCANNEEFASASALAIHIRDVHHDDLNNHRESRRKELAAQKATSGAIILKAELPEAQPTLEWSSSGPFTPNFTKQSSQKEKVQKNPPEPKVTPPTAAPSASEPFLKPAEKPVPALKVPQPAVTLVTSQPDPTPTECSEITKAPAPKVTLPVVIPSKPEAPAPKLPAPTGPQVNGKALIPGFKTHTSLNPAATEFEPANRGANSLHLVAGSYPLIGYPPGVLPNIYFSKPQHIESPQAVFISSIPWVLNEEAVQQTKDIGKPSQAKRCETETDRANEDLGQKRPKTPEGISAFEQRQDTVAEKLPVGVVGKEEDDMEIVSAELPVKRDLVAEIRALPKTSWEEVEYLRNKWSVIPEDHYETYLSILNDFCLTNDDLEKHNYTLTPLTVQEFKNMQRCYQCRNTIQTAECTIHPGRLSKKFNRETRKLERFFSCCKAMENKAHKVGCTTLPSHNFEDFASLARNWAFDVAPPVVPGVEKLKAVVLDCEMGGALFDRSELILLTVVDFFTGNQLINSLVKPSIPVKNWRTQYSGVAEAHMRTAIDTDNYIDGWQNARALLFQYIDRDTIVMGHSLNNDLDQLRLIHGRVIDAAILIPRLREHKHGVKGLTAELLGKNVQTGGKAGHNCLEDTLASRELVIWCLRNPEAFVARRKQSKKEQTEELRLRNERNKEEIARLKAENHELKQELRDLKKQFEERKGTEEEREEAEERRLLDLTPEQKGLLRALHLTGVNVKDAALFLKQSS